MVDDGGMGISRFALCIVGALIGLALFAVLPAEAGEFLLGFLGYYAIAATTGIWVVVLVLWWRARRPRAPRRAALLTLAGLLGVTGLLVTLEPNHYKVVLDEPILTGASQMMHRDRLALVPGRANWEDLNFELLDGWLDKRPLLFPFLQSLVHDVTGYRLENGFYLNHVLMFGVVGLLFLLGRRFGGVWGGWAAVGLLIGVPLAGNVASSAGLAPLSALLLLLALFFAIEYAERPKCRATLGALVLTLVLLANSRYEGALWILPFGLLILAVQRRSGTWQFPWTVCVAPLLMMLPVAQRLVDYQHNVYWQAGPEGREDTFSLGFLGDNLEAAAVYFFGTVTPSTNGYLTAVLGFAAMLVLSLFLLLRRWVPGDSKPLAPVEWAAGFFLAGLWALFALLMVFNYGVFTMYQVQRLAFPFHLGFALCVVWAWTRLPRPFLFGSLCVALYVVALGLQAMTATELVERGMVQLLGTVVLAGGWLLLLRQEWFHPAWLAGLAAVAFLFVGLPTSRAHRYVHAYATGEGSWAVTEFVEAHAADDFIFVFHHPLLGVLRERASVAARDVFGNPGMMRHRLRTGEAYRKAYYAQFYRYHRPSATWQPLYPYDLSRVLALAPLESRRISPNVEVRFFEILPTEWVPPAPPPE